MDTVFMSSENSKTSDPHRLLINLSDKINSKRSDKYAALSSLSIYYTWKNIKKSYKSNNPSIMIYVNDIENRITFKIKTGYYLELLTPEGIKLLGSTKNKINKDKNGENYPHLEFTEVILVHCSIVNNEYQQDSRV